MFKKKGHTQKKKKRIVSKRPGYRESSSYSWSLIDEESEFKERLHDSSYSFYNRWDNLLQSRSKRA